jgi:PIN domain nuclease of toxin-antitoxin system
MSILLDTHVFIWAATNSHRLSHAAQSMLEDPEEPAFLSSISALEIAIKWSRRKLILPEPPLDFINKILLKSGISQLAVTIKDACGVAALPYHHNDPFDRLLVAQARENGLRLMTANPILERYDVDLIALWLDDDE